jgi:hypothetical protein
MGYYFDKRDELWRIQAQKDGSRISTTAKTKVEAHALDEKLKRDLGIMYRRKTGVLPELFPDQKAESLWSTAIEQAYHDRASWLWKIRYRIGHRHIKKQSNGAALSGDDLRTLYLESRGRCAVSGLRLVLPGGKTRSPLVASVDRIDGAYGYIVPNCRIVALCVNIAMSDWGEDLFKKLCYGVVAREFL